MKTRKKGDIGEIIAEGTLIDAALEEGAREALRRHQQAALPLATWRNGKVAWVPADTVHIEEEPPTSKR